MNATHKLGISLGLLTVGLLTSAASCSKFAISLTEDYRYTEAVQQTISFVGKMELSLHNSVGAVSLEPGPPDVIELVAIKKAKSQGDLENLTIEMQESPTGVRVRSLHPTSQGSKWAVEYSLRVPSGTRLEIDQGVGDVRIANHEGSTWVDLGVGNVRLENVRGDEISVDLGVGDVRLIGIESKSASASVGTGDLDVRIRPDASLIIDAHVGIGDLSIRGFPKIQIEREGFIAQSVRAVVGAGEGRLKLSVGVGDLDVRPLEAQTL
jgi:hypothetical protein